MKKLTDIVADFKILPRKIFIKSELQLVFIDVTKSASRIIVSICITSLILGFLSGIAFNKTQIVIVKVPIEIDLNSKHDVAIGGIGWKDSIFVDYKNRADLYLSQEEFLGTPLNGDILALAARNAFDSTGILLPLELALSQGQWESNMGRAGRSPINNPYNVGEYDNGTVLYFESTFDGVQAYYYLMCNNYLSCWSLNELFVNFVNCAGNRYASKAAYERSIKYKYYQIQEWIDENIRKQQIQRYEYK